MEGRYDPERLDDASRRRKKRQLEKTRLKREACSVFCFVLLCMIIIGMLIFFTVYSKFSRLEQSKTPPSNNELDQADPFASFIVKYVDYLDRFAARAATDSWDFLAEDCIWQVNLNLSASINSFNKQLSDYILRDSIKLQAHWAAETFPFNRETIRESLV